MKIELADEGSVGSMVLGSAVGLVVEECVGLVVGKSVDDKVSHAFII